jgi:hypothetical protein
LRQFRDRQNPEQGDVDREYTTMSPRRRRSSNGESAARIAILRNSALCHPP